MPLKEERTPRLMIDDILELRSVDSQPGKLKLRLLVDRVIDWEIAIKIVRMIGEADEDEHVSKTPQERSGG